MNIQTHMFQSCRVANFMFPSLNVSFIVQPKHHFELLPTIFLSLCLCLWVYVSLCVKFFLLFCFKNILMFLSFFRVLPLSMLMSLCFFELLWVSMSIYVIFNFLLPSYLSMSLCLCLSLCCCFTIFVSFFLCLCGSIFLLGMHDATTYKQVIKLLACQVVVNLLHACSWIIAEVYLLQGLQFFRPKYPIKEYKHSKENLFHIRI
jgi:hypothetical protein